MITPARRVHPHAAATRVSSNVYNSTVQVQRKRAHRRSTVHCTYGAEDLSDDGRTDEATTGRTVRT